MRKLLAGAALALALVAVPAPARAETAPPAPPTTTATPSVPQAKGGGCGVLGVDCLTRLPGAIAGLPGQIADAMFNRIDSRAKASAQRNVSHALTIALAASKTPDFTSWARMRDIWEWAVVILNGVPVLMLVVSLLGFGSMAPRITGWTAHVIGPRLVLAWVMADVALVFIALGIQVSNALAGIFTEQLHPAQFSAQGSALASGMPWLLIAMVSIFSILLVVTTIFRVVALVILGAAGPWAQVTIVTPQSGVVARLWWRAMLMLLLIPVLQMLVMGIMVNLFASQDASVQGLFGGGPWISGGVVLVGVIILAGIPILLLLAVIRPAVKVVVGYKALDRTIRPAAQAAHGVAERAASSRVGSAVSRAGTALP